MLDLMVLWCLTVLLKSILALHFSSCRNYLGGGGQNDMFATPIFSLGGKTASLPPPPPPPRIDASVNSGLGLEKKYLLTLWFDIQIWNKTTSSCLMFFLQIGTSCPFLAGNYL